MVQISFSSGFHFLFDDVMRHNNNYSRPLALRNNTGGAAPTTLNWGGTIEEKLKTESAADSVTVKETRVSPAQHSQSDYHRQVGREGMT